MLDLKVSLVEGLKLWLVSPDFPRAPLSPKLARQCWDEPPFWAFVWPGGRWLAQCLPHAKAPKTVIDLGCGSGILSLALARAGWRCWAVDSDPQARQMTLRNAAENGLQVPVAASLDEVEEEVELVVLADFLYDPANLGQLEDLRRRYPEVLLADCRLHQLPPAFVQIPTRPQRVVPDLDWNNDFDQLLAAATPTAAAWFVDPYAGHPDPTN